MENQITKNGEIIAPEIIESIVINNDLSKLSANQKVDYYNHFCKSLGLNPLTQPFQIISFQGKQRLYAAKDCTEQLRKLHGVSIVELTSQEIKGVFVVTAKATDKSGRSDAATGAVTIGNKGGDDLANLLMKAETKAKRRVTLSICGLGMLDESELETMPKHITSTVTNKITDESTKPQEKLPPASPKAVETQKPTATPKEVSKEIQEKITVVDEASNDSELLEWLGNQTAETKKDLSFRDAVSKKFTTVKISEPTKNKMYVCKNLIELEDFYKKNQWLKDNKEFNEIFRKYKGILSAPTN